MKLHSSVLRVLLLLALWLGNYCINAQQEPTKWGKVPQADMQMASYAADADAKAVVLFDIGQVSMRMVEGLQYHFRHHRRIKILEGVALASDTFDITYYYRENTEKLLQAKAQYFLPNGRREVIGKKGMIDLVLNDSMAIKRIIFPKLEKGSIIEFRYELMSAHIAKLPDWFFQLDIPVRYSELKVDLPVYFKYIPYIQNTDRLIKKEERSTTVVMETDERFTMETDSKVEIKSNRYIMENVPAMTAAPFTTTIDDHRARIRLRLNQIVYPSGKVERFLPSWQGMAKQLESDPQFGQQYENPERSKLIAAAADSIIRRDISKKEKLQGLYSFINQQLQWNHEYSVLAGTSPDSAFIRGRANSSEMNLALLALLRKAKIKSFPLLISTRSHGKLFQQYPSIDQFNHVLVFAMIEDESYFLDTGDPYRPYNLPSAQSVNGYGWLLNGDDADWIPIDPPRSIMNYLTYCSLDGSGSLSGAVEGNFKGYAAANIQEKYAVQKDDGHWKNQLSKRFPEVRIDSSSAMPELTAGGSLDVRFKFEIPNAARKEKDRLYITPVLLSNYLDTLLTADTRSYPVSIPYPIKEQFVMVMDIPEGYEVEFLPNSTRVLINDFGGDFHYIINQKDDKIQLISRINIRKLQYNPEEYDDIKEFFEHIATKFGEEIIFKRLERG